jgi:hypothetical protein
MKRITNICFGTVWAVWIGGAAWGLAIGDESFSDLVAHPSAPAGQLAAGQGLPSQLRPGQSGAIALVPPKASIAAATIASGALLAKSMSPDPTAAPSGPHMLSSLQDCTAVTALDKSAGSACDAHGAKPPIMAPAVFHEHDSN